jgi:hypothetical protein
MSHCSTLMSAAFYRATWRDIPQVSNLHSHSEEIVTFHKQQNVVLFQILFVISEFCLSF